MESNDSLCTVCVPFSPKNFINKVRAGTMATGDGAACACRVHGKRYGSAENRADRRRRPQSVNNSVGFHLPRNPIGLTDSSSTKKPEKFLSGSVKPFGFRVTRNRNPLLTRYISILYTYTWAQQQP